MASTRSNALALGLLTALVPSSLGAQKNPPCLPTAQVLVTMPKVYGEELRASFVSRDGTRYLLFTSKRHTWTLFVQNKDTACVIDAGGLISYPERI